MECQVYVRLKEMTKASENLKFCCGMFLSSFRGWLHESERITNHKSPGEQFIVLVFVSVSCSCNLSNKLVWSYQIFDTLKGIYELFVMVQIELPEGERREFSLIKTSCRSVRQRVPLPSIAIFLG